MGELVVITRLMAASARVIQRSHADPGLSTWQGGCKKHKQFVTADVVLGVRIQWQPMAGELFQAEALTELSEHPAWDPRNPRGPAEPAQDPCGSAPHDGLWSRPNKKPLESKPSLSLLLGRAWTRVDPRLTTGPHRFLMNAVWDPSSIT